ncbi:DNRLRE domain-containing protein [Paenibacillus sp. N1-5-1-14]|uniref:CBM96 family carbohydrate-binding protein n=1 Tax=Paenibacillus radicibacter TaxID=2972488 RepID=UPI002159832D|nr:DNRLRE domain-containing protein [Paenibacillus radicibacter]MCR8643409.1 DNRLRE domain-containing protein [Paenibacillus radicibacter]
MLNKRASMLIGMIVTLLLSLLTFVVGSPEIARAAGSNYYVDAASGNDTNSGTSASDAWKSLNKLNSTTFAPGDQILLKAGSVWNGQLWPKGSGTSGNPIVIDQYGTGNKPIINGNGTQYPANTSGAVMLYNQEYWEINNMEVTNYSTTITSSRSGILVYNNEEGLKNHIVIRNTYVHDVNSDPNGNKNSGGIIFFGTHINKDGVATIGRKAGFNDVLVENNHVKNVTKEGIRNKSDSGNSVYPRINTNIVFRSNVIEDIFGDGMVLAEVLSGAKAEYNIVKNHSMTTSANYAGLWTHYTTGALVQYNEVYGGMNGYNDGEAFDSDNNTNGDIFQYNYSHNNKGGFMLIMPSTQNLKVRYNVSENDGGGLNNHLFHYTNNNTNNYVYNNTFYIGAGVQNYIFAPTSMTTIQPKFYNNIIKADGTVTKFSNNVTWGAQTEFKNNLFYPATIDDVNGPPAHPGLITVDPQLVNPGAGVSNIDMNDPNRLPEYKLQDTSPAINAGLTITGNGGQDFYGNSVSNTPDIGAYESSVLVSGVTFNPTEDAYVRNGTYAGTNYGTDTGLWVKSDATSYARKAYLKFDYTGYSGSSTSLAKLRLHVNSANTSPSRTIKVYGTTNSWTESGLNWNNAPAGATYIGSFTVSNTAGIWYEVDVTSYVNSNMASGKKISLMLVNEDAASSTNDVQFSSRESAATMPELVIQ